MKRQVFCIVRKDPDDPNSPIFKIGGFNWQFNVDEVWAKIENNEDSFFVDDGEGKEVEVITTNKTGPRHFRTTPDESKINNLENLRSCDEYNIDITASLISKQSK